MNTCADIPRMPSGAEEISFKLNIYASVKPTAHTSNDIHVTLPVGHLNFSINKDRLMEVKYWGGSE